MQLIAHDKEVFDVAFATRGKDVFGSVGADGSVRIFDKRCAGTRPLVVLRPPRPVAAASGGGGGGGCARA